VLLAGFAAVWIGNVVYYASTAWSGNQGRYLLPGIAVWGALIVLGLEALMPKRLRAYGLGAFACLWVGAAAACLFGYFLPAYGARALPPAIEYPRSLRYDDTAELIGVGQTMLRARPGETLTIATYWRALAPSQTPLYTYVHTEDDLVRIDSLPGNGHLLAAEFEPGQTWADVFTVTIPADAQQQTIHPLLVGLYDPATNAVIAASENGENVLPLVATIAVAGEAQQTNPTYRFGDRIGLEMPTLALTDGAVRVCLPWAALQDGAGDYTVFVHLTDADGQMIAQGDHTPRAGEAAYPTGAWSAGERVEDCFTLPLDTPASGLTLLVGMYDPLSGTRLPVIDHDGARLPDDVIRLPLSG
jgi:hypothetical protein